MKSSLINRPPAEPVWLKPAQLAAFDARLNELADDLVPFMTFANEVQLQEPVKGASSSQHVKGQAVDFEIPGIANGDIAAWIRFNLQFDQLILEAYTPGHPSSGWVHCSWTPGGRRMSVLTFVPGKGYFNGLSV